MYLCVERVCVCVCVCACARVFLPAAVAIEKGLQINHAAFDCRGSRRNQPTAASIRFTVHFTSLSRTNRSGFSFVSFFHFFSPFSLYFFLFSGYIFPRPFFYTHTQAAFVLYIKTYAHEHIYTFFIHRHTCGRIHCIYTYTGICWFPYLRILFLNKYTIILRCTYFYILNWI